MNIRSNETSLYFYYYSESKTCLVESILNTKCFLNYLRTRMSKDVYGIWFLVGRNQHCKDSDT
jgi:hypothetical protein